MASKGLAMTSIAGGHQDMELVSPSPPGTPSETQN